MNTWTTKEGKKMKIREMETSHIRNCIRMLENFIDSRPDPYMHGEPSGDAAQDAFNSEIRHNDALEAEAKEKVSQFKRELKRRQT